MAKSSTSFSKGHRINLGRKHTDQSKKKMSETKKGKPIFSLRGDKSHLYKDGRSKNVEYRNWQKNKRNIVKKLVETNEIKTISHLIG